MLKEDKTARFHYDPNSVLNITFFAGSHLNTSANYIASLTQKTITDLKAKSKTVPILIPEVKHRIKVRGGYHTVNNVGKNWWLWEGKFYVTEEDLRAEDVIALVMERDNTKRLKLEKAHALQAMREQLDSKAKRQPIPQEVKIVVWQRDKGRCVECESNKDLEYDHIIPLSMGGSNTERNLQLLCAVCNRRKGGTLG